MLKLKKIIGRFKNNINAAALMIIKQIFTLFLKKDPKLVLFGAHNGDFYSDNSKHLFEWVLKEKPDINACWITRSNKIYEKLKSSGKPVETMNSIEGIKLLAKAKVALYTNRPKDIAISSSLIPKTLGLIALRHGKSVKKIRYAREIHKISKKEYDDRKHESNLIKYVISTSEFVSDIQEECIRVGRDKHIVTGYPRNDYFFNPVYSHDILDRFISVDKKEEVILYAPTWRHGREPTRFFPFDDFSKELLVTFLKKHNAKILIRPHKNELKCKEIMDFLNDLTLGNDEITLVTHKDLHDVNMLLPFIDGMITDYSSIYHDFLLLDKPIIFIPYDYKEYNEQNGFLYDYFSNLPGPATKTLKEFCSLLADIFNGVDAYREKRRLLTDKIHKFKDGSSCRRVMALADKLLGS